MHKEHTDKDKIHLINSVNSNGFYPTNECVIFHYLICAYHVLALKGMQDKYGVLAHIPN